MKSFLEILTQQAGQNRFIVTTVTTGTIFIYGSNNSSFPLRWDGSCRNGNIRYMGQGLGAGGVLENVCTGMLKVDFRISTISRPSVL